MQTDGSRPRGSAVDSRTNRALATAGLLVGVLAGGALIAAGPPDPVSRHQVAELTSFAAGEPLDRAIGAAAAMLGRLGLGLGLGWLAVAVVTSAATALPGMAGSLAARVVRWVTPLTLHRAVLAALGVGVVAGLTGPVPAAAMPAGSASPAPIVGALPLPVPGTANGRSDAVATAGQPPAVVIVARGDCLWRIAARALPAASARSTVAVAAAWPVWYRTNRAVIGANPDLIYPGQRLTNPGRRPLAPREPS